jgi:two-component system OmpR family response regulator
MTTEPKGRVLCVDDEPDAALSLTTLLSLHGYVARAAHDGPTALALARRFRPTACVVDIRMPGMDGYQLAARLRDEVDPCPVLVAVSGLSRDEYAEPATAAGFGWMFSKPIDPADLLAALEASALDAGE